MRGTAGTYRPGARSGDRSRLTLLVVAAVSIAATAAGLSWNNRSPDGNGAAAARAFAEDPSDVSRQINAVTAVLRDVRESIQTLKRVEVEGGQAGQQASAALFRIAEALR